LLRDAAIENILGLQLTVKFANIILIIKQIYFYSHAKAKTKRRRVIYQW